MNWICFELRLLAIRHLLYAGCKKYANSNDYYYFLLYLLIDSHFFFRSNIFHFTFDSHNSKNHNSQSSHTCALLNGKKSIKMEKMDKAKKQKPHSHTRRMCVRNAAHFIFKSKFYFSMNSVKD